MMNPEMIKLAQEQISPIPPDQFLKMQQQTFCDIVWEKTKGECSWGRSLSLKTIDPTKKEFVCASNIAAESGMPPNSLVTLSDVSKLCRDGQLNSVLSAMDIIENRGLHISVHMLSNLLQLCMDRTDSRAGKALHHLLIRLGYDEIDHFASQVIHMYLLFGSLPEALQALIKLSIANVLIWNAVICAYAKIGSNEQALKLYYQMQQSGVIPDGHILVAALKACSALASLDDGRLIHGYIIMRGLETSSFILSTLIDMYSSCGSLAGSQRVFNAAPIQNVVAWNTFIKGHVEHGLELKAIELYHQMMQQGVEIDRITFITILRTCASVWDVDKGKAVHLEVVKKGVDSDSLIVARLIDMYSCSGQLQEAQLVFKEAPKQDVKVWNAMIAAHAQHGQNEAALVLVESLWQAGLEANISTSMSLLKDSASQVFSLDQVRFLHGTLVKMGFDRESLVMNTFINMYAKRGSLQDACRNFSSVLSPDLVTWNAIIGAHVLFEEGTEALKLFHHLQCKGCDPNGSIFCTSLNACSIVKAINEGNLIYSFIIERGLDTETLVVNNLIDMYIKCGNLIDAFKVFESLANRDVFTWTKLMSGCVQHCQYEKALQLFHEMQDVGLLPNHVTLGIVLKACHSPSMLDQGIFLHDYIVARGLDSEVPIINALISMYTKCGTLQDGRKVFYNSCKKDVVTWTSMIDACVQHESGPEAVYLSMKMQREGIEPDRAAFLSAFKACSSVAAISQGKTLHKRSWERGLCSDSSVVNSLIDMYMKCGSIVDAQRVFREALSRDIVTWTSMIAGCARYRNYQLALDYFQNMLQAGVKPNNVTFLALLSVCAHLGLAEEGLSHFKSMLNCGIPATLEHFTSIAEVFACAGDLDTAEDVFETCPFHVDIAGWLCLLPHCKNSLRVAERFFDYLTSMGCANAAGFILMANIYVAAGLKEDAASVENLRNCANAWKKAGKAYIEVDDNVHEFICGDKRIPEIDAKLAELTAEISATGYVPLVDLVLQCTPDEEKQGFLCGHCEKQAIAFGLLNTAPGATIRVSKNLRMCADCHSASSIISKVKKREIIVTDDSCVHVFKDGSCSCKF